jgi:hypothetical protein
MEFNFLSQFRNVDVGLLSFENHYEHGAAFFTESQLGERLLGPIDACARKRRLSRRTFLKTASGLAAALYAVNQVTGMRLFDVSEAAAVDEAAAQEAFAGTEFIIDAHTHVAWRQAGFTKDNTTERGMWFVDLLDNLGKTMGLKNGIRDMDVEGFGAHPVQGRRYGHGHRQSVRLSRGLRRSRHEPHRGSRRSAKPLA